MEDTLFNRDILHPVGVAALAALSLAVVLAPRPRVMLPVLALVCLVASGQRIIVLGLDFSFLRILVDVALLRVFLRGEFVGLRWNALDFVVGAWSVSGTVALVARLGTPEAFILRLGIMHDAVGMYLLCRCLVRGTADVLAITDYLIGFAMVVAVAFILENRTGRNVFAAFGGVPEITVIREGRLRCQGAFPHPILAGVFWASVVALMLARYASASVGRGGPILGVVCSVVVVFLSASSTPVMSLAAVFAAFACLPLRHNLGYLRLACVGALISLHLMMKAPVWHLISRVDAAGGSTGWHRYHLIDSAIRTFSSWWLIGTEAYVDWGHELLTVQYVAEGVTGGILTLVLFGAAIWLAFRYVGRAVARAASRRDLLVAWGIGACILGQCVGFLGVVYNGQVWLLWFLSLAMAGSLAGEAQVVKLAPHDADSDRDSTGAEQGDP